MSALRNKRNKGLTGLAALPRAISAFGGGIVAMAVAGGCGTEPPLPVPAAIMITPDSAILPRLGDTVQLTATVQDMDGRTISGSQVNWASGDESVVTVNTTGLVAAVGEGVAPVRAAVGGVEARSMVTVDLQRGVLVRIYEAMGGSRWFYNRNWGTDEPLHSWWGVGTDELGRVTRLSLNANALTGTIPAEVGALEALQSLSLSTNGLTGPIPAELGNLRELEWLVLGRNELTGSIPPELGNLQQLRRLSLSGNELTGPIPPELKTIS